MLEKKLQEELKRFRQINKYAQKLIMEAEGDEIAPPTEEPQAGEGMGDIPMGDAPLDTPSDTMTDTPIDMDANLPEDNVEEMDITDLVNMTKSIKKSIEDKETSDTNAISKMDNIFSKLDELEKKLSEMNSVIEKIDSLSLKIEKFRQPTPQERLEMRSLDSYPFTQKPNDFFQQKKQEMEMSGKNEYILTKDDISNYSQGEISKSFNPNDNY